MDWEMAIERNRKPLLRIVATLFAAIRLGEGSIVERLPWILYRMVLSILQPAEAAVRRLIVVVARDMVVKPPKARSAPAGLKKRSGKGKGKGRVSFRLFDPRKHFDWVYDPTTGERPEPSSHACDGEPKVPLFLRPQPPAPAPDGTVSAASLCRRLAAIKHALDDLASQARRYARWRAKPIEQRRPKVNSPLRPGPPPGHRKKPSHEVDAILSECHWLAWSLPEPDTS